MRTRIKIMIMIGIGIKIRIRVRGYCRLRSEESEHESGRGARHCKARDAADEPACRFCFKENGVCGFFYTVNYYSTVNNIRHQSYRIFGT